MTNHKAYEIGTISEPVMAMMTAVTSEPSFFDSFCAILTLKVRAI